MIYKAEILYALVRALFFWGVQLALWRALYANTTANSIYLWDEMVTYQVLSAGISAFLTVMTPMLTMEHDIYTGNLMQYLSKPINYQIQVMMMSIGRSLFSIIFTSMPLLLICGKVVRLVLPLSNVRLMLSIICLVLAWILFFEMYFIFGTISFWFFDRYHTIGLLLVNVVRILSGAVIPIGYFPPVLKRYVTALPIRYGFDFPLSIYFGKISIDYAVEGILQQMIWVLSLWFFGWILLRQGIKRFVVQGG